MSISHSSISRPAKHLLIVLTLVLGSWGGVTITGAAPAEARAAGVSPATAGKALSYGASRKGAPYRYGSAGPSRFDCSGFTKWSYARAGRRLPRTTAQQYAATIRVSRSHIRRGDLVFFLSGRAPYHVGIYAGSNRIWHSPKRGDHVRLAKIWTSRVTYGRVR